MNNAHRPFSGKVSPPREVPNPPEIPPLPSGVNQELPFELSQILNISDLKINDVLIFRYKGNKNPETNSILSHLFSKYKKDLTEKNISVIVLEENQSIEKIDEKYLNDMGYFREKEKSLIIH